jgi:hypothetical protein
MLPSAFPGRSESPPPPLSTETLKVRSALHRENGPNCTTVVDRRVLAKQRFSSRIRRNFGSRQARLSESEKGVMDILWPALGISIIVGFVLYVLAGHWGRALRQQAVAIRRLSDRLEMIEEVDDPRFRERICESAPAPLEQVFTFSFRFGERFWRETLRVSESDWGFIRRYGSFVGLVKLERWRSHTVASVTEVLPDRKTAAWQTRTLYSYPGEPSEALTLWELPLGKPSLDKDTPSLELSLEGNTLELCARFARSQPCQGTNGISTIFRVPLSRTSLAEFRGHDPAESLEGAGDRTENGNSTNSWRAFYAWEDEKRGIEWHLRVVDLKRKVDWERWKILESTAPQVTSGD